MASGADHIVPPLEHEAIRDHEEYEAMREYRFVAGYVCLRAIELAATIAPSHHVAIAVRRTFREQSHKKFTKDSQNCHQTVTQRCYARSHRGRATLGDVT